MSRHSKAKPKCEYNKGVGCALDERDCKHCGFNPRISRDRIRREYGEQYTKYLSKLDVDEPIEYQRG